MSPAKSGSQPNSAARRRERRAHLQPEALLQQYEENNHLATLDKAESGKTITRTVVEVERVKDAKITIPEGMTLKTLDGVIHARMEYEGKTVAIDAWIEAPTVLEAAYALYEVLTERYGWADITDTIKQTMFGPVKEPPTQISVPVGLNEDGTTRTVQVPWGSFKLPGVNGLLESSAGRKSKNSAFQFRIQGEVKRLDEDKVNEVVAAVQDRVRRNSIYKGQAFEIELTEEGEIKPMPEPKFIRIDPSVRRELVLPEMTRASVEANVFTIIQDTAWCREERIPLKRGILLAGPFGTGKTMVMHAVADLAVQNGWTYIVCRNPWELADIIRLARAYQPAIVSCEDIDRITRGDDRTMNTDELLNVIDGVESKGTELMVVFTTNELDKVTTAMLRPGRLDAVIHIGPPDAAAAERLMRQYGRGRIADDEQLVASAKELEGTIPAVIREAVEKAKLYRMNEILAEGGSHDDLSLTDTSILAAAVNMRAHRELLLPKEEDNRSETVKAAHVLAEAIAEHGRAAADGELLTDLPPVVFPVRPTGQTDGKGKHGADVVFAPKETITDDLPKGN